MTKEGVIARYYNMTLYDKLMIAAAVLYDLDVGDFSAYPRNKGWSEGFTKTIDTIEEALSEMILDEEHSKLEREAKAIAERIKNREPKKCGDCKWLDKETKTSIGYPCTNPEKVWRTTTANKRQKRTAACKCYQEE